MSCDSKWQRQKHHKVQISTHWNEFPRWTSALSETTATRMAHTYWRFIYTKHHANHVTKIASFNPEHNAMDRVLLLLFISCIKKLEYCDIKKNHTKFTNISKQSPWLGLHYICCLQGNRLPCYQNTDLLLPLQCYHWTPWLLDMLSSPAP